MKTDDLTRLLAYGDTAAVPPRAAARTLGAAATAAVPVAVLLMAVVLGVRPDLAVALSMPMFWVKVGVPLAIGVAGWRMTERLSRPGVPVGTAWLGLALPVVLLWMLGIATWFAAPDNTRVALFFGTWRACLISIPLISLPLLLASFAALRRLAPTRPALAGAAAGALSSGIGAAVYALHCPEMFAPFLAVWYVLGMALPVALGAALGPRLLRW